MFDVQSWFHLLGIELGMYDLATTDQLLYDEPPSVIPLMRFAFEQKVRKPIMFYVKYGYKTIVSDGENEYELGTGFYLVNCNKNTTILHKNFVHKFTSDNNDFSLHKIRPKILIGNIDYIPKSADEMVPMPAPLSVFVSKVHPPLDPTHCVPIDECMYYILPYELHRKSIQLFPFHVVKDCSYNEQIVKKLMKIFTVEWLSDMLCDKVFNGITEPSPRKLFTLRNSIVDGLCTVMATENTIDLAKLILAAPEIASIVDIHKENMQSI